MTDTLNKISEFVNSTYDEIIAIFIIVIVLGINGFQVIMGEYTMLPYELPMIVAGYLFGKKIN